MLAKLAAIDVEMTLAWQPGTIQVALFDRGTAREGVHMNSTFQVSAVGVRHAATPTIDGSTGRHLVEDHSHDGEHYRPKSTGSVWCVCNSKAIGDRPGGVEDGIGKEEELGGSYWPCMDDTAPQSAILLTASRGAMPCHYCNSVRWFRGNNR